MSTCHSYPANDSVVPTVEIGPSPAGVRAAASSVVTSTCPERTDTGRPPDTVIATCDYFNSPLKPSQPIPPHNLEAGQAMRQEYDSGAQASGCLELILQLINGFLTIFTRYLGERISFSESRKSYLSIAKFASARVLQLIGRFWTTENSLQNFLQALFLKVPVSYKDMFIFF